MKKILLLSLFFFTLSSGMVRAQSPSGSPSADLRRVRERIEQISKEKQDGDSTWHGILGTITKVGNTTFSLQDATGRERTIQIVENTEMLNTRGGTIKLTDLSINSGAAIIGRFRDELLVDARQVVMRDAAYTETRRVWLGTMVAVKTSSFDFSIRGSEEIKTGTTSRTTVVEDNLGNPIKLSDLEEDQAILIIANEVDGKTQVSRLRLLAPLSQ